MNFVNKPNTLKVTRKPGKNQFSGFLSYKNRTIICSLGKSGTCTFKNEGDGATPVGKFELLYGLYRKDRVTLPATQFPFFEIKEDNGWCDGPKHPQYNQPVRLPFAASHEKMFRKDGVYDICIILNYNIWPISQNRGSAIFFHLMNEEKGPTEGCVAIEKDQMLKLIPHLKPGMMMNIIL